VIDPNPWCASPVVDTLKREAPVMSKPSNSFAVIVELVCVRLGCDEREARNLLEAIGDAIAREALMRGNSLAWPRLGVFRAKSQKGRLVDLRGLKSIGNVPPSAPDQLQLAPMRKLRFSPSRDHALWRGSKP
jgi:nucleoid DNA-binding protein